MFVELGNDHAIEGYRIKEDQDDPNSPETLKFRELEGQRITRIEFHDDIELQDAYSQIVDGIIPAHFQADSKPAWIETDSEGLKTLLEEKYQIKGVTKPTGWGEN